MPRARLALVLGRLSEPWLTTTVTPRPTSRLRARLTSRSLRSSLRLRSLPLLPSSRSPRLSSLCGWTLPATRSHGPRSSRSPRKVTSRVLPRSLWRPESPKRAFVFTLKGPSLPRCTSGPSPFSRCTRLRKDTSPSPFSLSRLSGRRSTRRPLPAVVARGRASGAVAAVVAVAARPQTRSWPRFPKPPRAASCGSAARSVGPCAKRNVASAALRAVTPAALRAATSVATARSTGVSGALFATSADTVVASLSGALAAL
mmetsp:Transcript_14832/g.34839  ORF Transcript_14832/g.34839 Transcript_14832/m.34839 type:complete len:258 (+) Transcript_14832:2156-2929(+)